MRATCLYIVSAELRDHQGSSGEKTLMLVEKPPGPLSHIAYSILKSGFVVTPPLKPLWQSTEWSRNRCGRYHVIAFCGCQP